MENEVVLWRRGILHDDNQPEIGAAAELFEVSTEGSSQLLQILALDLTVYESFRDEFRKFYMWNEGFSTLSGHLDCILATSKDLRATTLGLMVNWAKSLLKGLESQSTQKVRTAITNVYQVPTTLSKYDWTDVSPKFDKLKEVTRKTRQIAYTARADTNALCSQSDALDIDESSSDSDSDSSEDGIEVILEDMACFMQSLVDLSPSLEYPAPDFVPKEIPNINFMEKLSGIPEPARPFATNINDRYPLINDYLLVKKLAEANWKRNEQLRAKTTSEKDNEQPVADDTTVSGVTKSSAPDSDVFSAPVVRKPESVTSFATSVGDELDRGRRRIPNPLGGHIFGTPFRCQYCGEMQRDIHNRAHWK